MRSADTTFGWGLLVMIALVSFTGGCFTKTVDPAYQAIVDRKQELPETGQLGAGDRIKIRVFNQKGLTGEFTVSEDGTINYPYIGRLEVQGLTCAQVEAEIERKLRDGYFKEPTPSCSIQEYNSKRIYVLGEVSSPGSYPYKANLTIVEAFALAGGATNRAATNGTKLTRTIEGKDIQVRVPMQQIVEGRRKNIQLLPGDVIYVPESAY